MLFVSACFVAWCGVVCCGVLWLACVCVVGVSCCDGVVLFCIDCLGIPNMIWVCAGMDVFVFFSFLDWQWQCHMRGIELGGSEEIGRLEEYKVRRMTALEWTGSDSTCNTS